MSHNDNEERALNSNGIPNAQAPPIRPPPLDSKNPNDLLIKGSQGRTQQGVAFEKAEGISQTPIEPPVVSDKHKTPYHNGGRGRPNSKHIIYMHLLTSQAQLTASDISHATDLTVRSVAALLRKMVSDGYVNTLKPSLHLGQRFSSIYWVVQ